MKKVGSEQTLGRPEGGRIPFRTIRVVDRNKGGLAALSQANIEINQGFIDLMPKILDLDLLFVGVRLGDAWRLPDPRHLHVVFEFGFALVNTPADRRG